MKCRGVLLLSSLALPLIAGCSGPAPATMLATRAPAVSEPSLAAVPTIPEFVRVGLATDLEVFRPECCGSGLSIRAGGQSIAAVEPIRIEPFAPPSPEGSFRLQVAALKDEVQAVGLASAVGRRLGVEGDAVFDAGTDLYRVRIGRYDDRDAAERAARELAAAGIDGGWVVRESSDAVLAGFRVSRGHEHRRVEGRWLELESEGDAGIRALGGRYRGRLLIYLNDRGLLNVINEIRLEDYLRGVVPREMGPRIYDEIEALKAQAVAARTYTVRNLGEFVGEGYDICATPRCQVYGGMDSEDAFTDRAIRETAGQLLLWGGEAIDALYTSTCGGHTEDVEVVFPMKNHPYLRGVPCHEGGPQHLSGAATTKRGFAGEVMARVLPATENALSPRDLDARLEHLALLAGAGLDAPPLVSLDRGAVARRMATLLGGEEPAMLLGPAADVSYLLGTHPESWSESDRRAVAWLRSRGLLAGSAGEAVTPAEVDASLLALALELRVLEERSVRYRAIEPGLLVVDDGGEGDRWRLEPDVVTFRRLGDRLEAAALPLVASDRLTLYLMRGRLIAVVQEVDPDGTAFDRTSNRSTWTRFHTDDELVAMVEERYPGLGFRGFDLGPRGRSGRVSAIELHGRDGRRQRVEGLAVRWTLEIPDTWFTVQRLEPRGASPGWRFVGRGWGHGVGMCQVGAYGMAVRGRNYEEILRHYYTDVEVGVAAVAARTPQAGGGARGSR